MLPPLLLWRVSFSLSALFPPSRADYLHALELEPSHLPARVNLAFVLQAEGKFQEAWHELTSALEWNKNYIPALEARAIISLQMGNLFESFTDLTTAIDVSGCSLVPRPSLPYSLMP